MITYHTTVDGVAPAHLAGFFEGWPDPPSPETHLRLLRASAHVVLARDDGGDDVVGFVNAISDGVLSAYIPLLEVRPAYRGRGIGGELMRRMLATLDDLYMADLVCDAALIPFYERFGMMALTGMAKRNFDAQSGRR
jgi:ribosomal protein S18 acetylase RimI-like enzyme